MLNINWILFSLYWRQLYSRGLSGPGITILYLRVNSHLVFTSKLFYCSKIVAYLKRLSLKAALWPSSLVCGKIHRVTSSLALTVVLITHISVGYHTEIYFRVTLENRSCTYFREGRVPVSTFHKYEFMEIVKLKSYCPSGWPWICPSLLNQLLHSGTWYFCRLRSPGDTDNISLPPNCPCRAMRSPIIHPQSTCLPRTR